MPRLLSVSILLWVCTLLYADVLAHDQAQTKIADYYPERHHWASQDPRAAGFDSEKLSQAVDFAQSQAVTEPSDIHQILIDNYTGKEPNYRVLGPTKPRAGSSGMVIRGGYIVAQWGDTKRVDMTFSAVKSYLSTVAALALDDGLINGIDDPLQNYVTDGKFDSEHNRSITWHHLLQQTSDWQGSLWDTPDWADRPVGDTLEQQQNRELYPPGTHFKYNDVRVNLLAYSLLQVWREPLPQVLKNRIMDPIGASTTWRWHGYENSWVDLDGQRMQSVSGGGHFGGGLFISAEDHARFGLLFLRKGNWNGQQLFSQNWIEQLIQPTEARQDYGYMWWLNTNKERLPAAPESAYYAAGFGGNYIYVDNENDLVIVLRWIPDIAAVIGQFLNALD